MTNEKQGIAGNASDVIYQHVMQRFNKLTELIDRFEQNSDNQVNF